MDKRILALMVRQNGRQRLPLASSAGTCLLCWKRSGVSLDNVHTRAFLFTNPPVPKKGFVKKYFL